MNKKISNFFLFFFIFFSQTKLPKPRSIETDTSANGFYKVHYFDGTESVISQSDILCITKEKFNEIIEKIMNDSTSDSSSSETEVEDTKSPRLRDSGYKSGTKEGKRTNYDSSVTSIGSF